MFRSLLGNLAIFSSCTACCCALPAIQLALGMDATLRPA